MQLVDEYYTENDNKYVNITFTKSGKNDDSSIPLEYNVTKTSPVVDNASEYYITVVKFNIPLQSIPILIFPAVPNQGNPNLSPIIIGIRNGVDFLQNVIYIPQTSFPVPVQSGPKQVITPYYFVYSYTHMIEMINIALQAAFINAGLNNLGTGISNIAPYFVYDAESGLFSLIVNNSFNSPTGPQIVFNYRLFQFLDNFDTIDDFPNGLFILKIYGVVNESMAYDYYGITPPATVAPPFTPSAPPVFPVIPQPYFYKITQDSVNVSEWNPIKILFLTTGLPITFEIIPATSSLNNDGVFSSLNIITEFTPQIEKPGDARSIAYYTAPGYGGVRLTDMTTNTPLYKIDVKIFWQDTSNNIYPVVIPSFSQANIKLGFIRKTLYKNIH
jgi:hypothetical protein